MFKGKTIAILLGIALLFTSNQSAKADIFRLLDNDQEAIQCRVDLIQQAEEEILISYYILSKDVVGLQLLKLLKDAANRGVKVKFILDAHGGKVSKALLQYLKENNVQIRFYNKPEFPRLRTYFHRLHDKLLIVDKEHLILGGRNISQEYFALKEKWNFLDRDVYVKGQEPLAESHHYFLDLWDNAKILSENKMSGVKPHKIQKARKQLQEADSIFFSNPDILNNNGYDWSTDQKEVESVSFFHEEIKKDNIKSKDVTYILLQLIDEAKESIIIENPYFVPTKMWESAFQRALDRGVRIRVLTNSIASNDVLLMQGAYLNARGKIVRMGIEIWEYQGPKILHVKSAVIDSSISVVGSYNIHAVSQNWNTEVIAVTKDKELALEHLEIMDDNLTSALWINTRNRAEYPKKQEAGKWRTFVTKLSQYTLSAILQPIL